MVLLLALGLAHAAPDVVLVGNSYVMFNDLDQHVGRLLASDPGSEQALAMRLADGGLRFVDHVERAEGAHPTWVAELGPTGGADWVVLQEQSQIPGFPASNAEVVASRAAAVQLDGFARTIGAQTVFLATWGRRDGDATNPAVYPDFPTMNAALEAGYLAYRDATSTAERTVWIAPAGRAWKAVYDAELAAGADPLAPGSAFARLYHNDGSHPSPAGTYLTACVVYVAITGRTCVGKAGLDGIPAADLLSLQTIATDTVIDSAAELDYPWEGGEPDTDAQIDGPKVEDPEESAGGRCDQGGAVGAVGVWGVALLARRRRA